MGGMPGATNPKRPPGPMATFIVRVSQDESGQLRGIVQRVATGLKVRVHGAAEIGRIIEEVTDRSAPRAS